MIFMCTRVSAASSPSDAFSWEYGNPWHVVTPLMLVVFLLQLPLGAAYGGPAGTPCKASQAACAPRSVLQGRVLFRLWMQRAAESHSGSSQRSSTTS